MNIKFVLIIVIVLVAGPSVIAQTSATSKPAAKPASSAGAADGEIPKMKVAIIDVLAFRERIGELKAKYDKLQTEFGTRYQQLQAMETKLGAQEKTLSENKSLTPQQATKLTEEFEQGKREYQRTLEDSQVQARKREQEETESIYDKLSKFLDQYCAKQGITHVFDARRLQETGIVVYAAPTANITDEFIKEYNKAYPTPTAASAKP